MDKMLDEMKEADEEFALDTIPEISEELVAEIMNEVKTRERRLDETKMSNFRELMKKEDEDRQKKSKTAAKDSKNLKPIIIVSVLAVVAALVWFSYGG